tara:strand:+ start:914 stop:1930 length:1017 start_codon:yes stop_codon:yes gene_type:complete
MSNLALRSPQYKAVDVSGSTILSTVLSIALDNVPAYTIAKNKVTGVTSTVFEISELCRDYLIMQFSGNNTSRTVEIDCTFTNYTGLDGTGTVVGTPTTSTDFGWEAYGAYIDGANPSNTASRTIPTWLIAPIKSESYSINTFEIFVPIGVSGYVAGVNSTGQKLTQSFNSTDTEVSNSSLVDDVKINRINCSKYGNGRKIVFVNKYGAQQDLWFSLKETQNIRRRNENYESSTLQYDDAVPYYNTSDTPVKTFNTTAQKSYSLNSGYLPEGATEWFEQLLLSEYVWMVVYRKENPASPVTIPVRVKSSSVELKNSVNNRLINYTIEFEDAFNYINNIR